MKSNYLTTMTVQIPREGTVIRNEKTVEYQMDRTYAPEDKSTRVKRKVIGKVDPVQLGRMFPNELYSWGGCFRMSYILNCFRTMRFRRKSGMSF